MDAEELAKWHEELDKLKEEYPKFDDGQLFDTFISLNADELNRKGVFTRQPNAREAFDTWKKARG
jgi:hypothetical protein